MSLNIPCKTFRTIVPRYNIPRNNVPCDNCSSRQLFQVTIVPLDNCSSQNLFLRSFTNGHLQRGRSLGWPIEYLPQLSQSLISLTDENRKNKDQNSNKRFALFTLSSLFYFSGTPCISINCKSKSRAHIDSILLNWLKHVIYNFFSLQNHIRYRYTYSRTNVSLSLIGQEIFWPMRYCNTLKSCWNPKRMRGIGMLT